MLLESFGTRLKNTRENAGLSQAKLSELTGIGREQISRIENGQINSTLETIHKLSMALGISLSNLLNFRVVNKASFKKIEIKPFVKWAGGKAQLLDEIKLLLPKKFNTYFEPFVGGGALFLNLIPNKAVISDYNNELISTYICFKSKRNFNLMIRKIIEHENNHSEDYYYKVREMDRDDNYNSLPIHVRAARLIYLNKACFNGLYRVNAKGFFNVPSGKKKNVKAYYPELFENLHQYLKSPNITILNDDFEKTVLLAKKGDFVYFDPPYDSFDEQNNFTTYTKDNFGKDEQVRLSQVFKKLSKKGVFVMLSNHNTPLIRELYKEFNIKIIHARRNINSKGHGRGSVEEVLITNYEQE